MAKDIGSPSKKRTLAVPITLATMQSALPLVLPSSRLTHKPLQPYGPQSQPQKFKAFVVIRVKISLWPAKIGRGPPR